MASLVSRARLVWLFILAMNVVVMAGFRFLRQSHEPVILRDEIVFSLLGALAVVASVVVTPRELVHFARQSRVRIEQGELVGEPAEVAALQSQMVLGTLRGVGILLATSICGIYFATHGMTGVGYAFAGVSAVLILARFPTEDGYRATFERVLRK